MNDISTTNKKVVWMGILNYMKSISESAENEVKDMGKRNFSNLEMYDLQEIINNLEKVESMVKEQLIKIRDLKITW